MSSKPRRPSPEEEQYNDAIEQELDDLDEMWLIGMQMGHIPGGYPEGWDQEMEAAYIGESTATTNEGSLDSSPEEWRDFLKKLEEDLG